MKKDKTKGLDKKVKRALRREFESRLNEQAALVVEQMGFKSKQAVKAIEKNSKQLARKLTRIINENERSVKGVSKPQSEEDVTTNGQHGNAPEFSSPQPLSLQEENRENKKPVIPSDTPSVPSAVELAEKIAKA